MHESRQLEQCGSHLSCCEHAFFFREGEQGFEQRAIPHAFHLLLLGSHLLPVASETPCLDMHFKKLDQPLGRGGAGLG